MHLLKNLHQGQKGLLNPQIGIENQDPGTLEEVDLDPEMRVGIEDRNPVVLQGVIVSQKIEKTGIKKSIVRVSNQRNILKNQKEKIHLQMLKKNKLQKIQITKKSLLLNLINSIF